MVSGKFPNILRRGILIHFSKNHGCNPKLFIHVHVTHMRYTCTVHVLTSHRWQAILFFCRAHGICQTCKALRELCWGTEGFQLTVRLQSFAAGAVIILCRASPGRPDNISCHTVIHHGRLAVREFKYDAYADVVCMFWMVNIAAQHTYTQNR